MSARTIDTQAQLSDLPPRSVVRDPKGRIWELHQDTWVALGRLSAPASVPMPCHVLWVGEVTP